MKVRKELLGRQAAVKATMLRAHLAWAQKRFGDVGRLRAHLDAECNAVLESRMFPTDWVPFRCLVAIDRAIAAAAGGIPDTVFRELGRHSASVNLGGVYKGFVSTEPHRFFGQMGVLHNQFQNFGVSQYVKRGDRSGQVVFENYTEYSPVYCASAQGYFEEVLKVMNAPGPIRVSESSCQCAGDRQCVFEMTW